MPPEIYCHKISQYSQENTCVEAGLYQKETLTQMLSCKYWEISKKTIFKKICYACF